MNEKEIKRLIGYLKEGGELGRMPNSSVAIIIEALEKQVPQKWKRNTDEYDCEYLECPKCKEVFFDANEDTVDIVPQYCPNCGQALK